MFSVKIFDERAATLVVGIAGSGKTAMLIDAVADSAKSGQPLNSTPVFAVSRQAAQVLRTKILDAVGKTQRDPQVTTMHAWAQGLMQRFTPGDREPLKVLTAPEQEFRLRELIAGYQFDWPQEFRQAVKTKAFVRQLRAFLARVRQHSLDASDLITRGGNFVALGQFFEHYLDVLDAEGVIDYSELIHRSRILITQEAGQVLAGELKTIYVDDFQELDQAQVSLLADLHSFGIGVVAFTNPNTSVFRFRGADPRSAIDFDEVFNGHTRRIELTESKRAKPQLARVFSSVASRLDYRGQIVQQAHPALGNDVEAVVVKDPNSYICSRLRLAHCRGVAWHDMAVISRAGGAAVSQLARLLTSSGVPVHAAGDELALAQEVSVRALITVLEAGLARFDGQEIHDSIWQTMLTGPIGGMTTLELRTGKEDGKIRLNKLLDKIAEGISSGNDTASLLWRIWSFSNWPDRLRTTALSASDESDRANRDLDAVIALFDAAERTKLGGKRGVKQLLDEISSQQIAADTSRESDSAQLGVNVLTTHRAVAKTWPLVVVTGLEEGTWPRLLPPPDLFDDPISISQQICAERRAFLLAITRASEKLIVVGTQDEEAGIKPSRFLSELEVDINTPNQEPLANLDSLVARLRDSAADTVLSSGLRNQAIALLADLKSQTDSLGRPLVPAADPMNWWKIAKFSDEALPKTPTARSIRLSGTDLDALLACPRQWFLGRKVRAETPTNSSALVGTLIHQLAQDSAKDGLSYEELATRLENSWHEIDFDAAWLSEVEHESALASLRRLVDWHSRRKDEHLLGTEVPFFVEVSIAGQPIQLVGKVDRLEVDSSGALRIIDYKTAKKPPTKKEVHALGQLGVYQLAAKNGAFSALTTSTRLADALLVYLRVADTKTDLPKVMVQPSLDAHPQIVGEEETSPTWVEARLAKAAEIVRDQDYRAITGKQCSYCAYAADCPAKITLEER